MERSEGPIVYIHIPKTGGSSVDAFLAQHLSDLKFCPAKFYPDLRKYSQSELSQFDVFSGHFGVGDSDNIKNPRFITVIRHPVERVVSLYTYWKAQADTYQGTKKNDPFHAGVARAIRSENIEDFLNSLDPSVRATFSNTQCRFIATSPSRHVTIGDVAYAYFYNRAIRNLQRDFFWYGTTEKLDEELPVLLKRLGSKRGARLKVPRLNQTPSDHRNIDLSRKVYDRIVSVNEADMALYEYVAQHPVS